MLAYCIVYRHKGILYQFMFTAIYFHFAKFMWADHVIWNVLSVYCNLHYVIIKLIALHSNINENNKRKKRQISWKLIENDEESKKMGFNKWSLVIIIICTRNINDKYGSLLTIKSLSTVSIKNNKDFNLLFWYILMRNIFFGRNNRKILFTEY